jgi:hypothetical protein
LYFFFLIKLFLLVKVYHLNRSKTNNMKIALLSAFSILILSGCTKTYNYPTVNQVFSAVYTVQASQWAKGTDPDSTVFYYTTLSVPELTQAIDQNGGVVTYLSFDAPTATDPTYEAMPEVFNGIAYGSIHTTGSVTIDLRGADGSSLTSAISAPTLIKVVLMDAKPLGN